MSIFKLLLALSVLIFASMGCAGCTHLIYQPSDVMFLQNSDQLNGIREEVSFNSSDGTKLAGWYFKARKGTHHGAILQFHGNAQNMTSHFASVFWLIDEGYDVFTFDYRGYGISEGKPSQEGVNRDAVAAIHYLMQRETPAARDIVLYGQSLGGAVLLRAFDDVSPEERARVKALVVEGTFHNYHEIARNMLSRSWISFVFQPLAYVLVSNAYGPQDSIAHVAPTPMLVIHGDQDPVIPLSFGKKVFALAKEPKKFLLIPGGMHIDAMAVNKGQYRAQLLEFLDKPE